MSERPSELDLALREAIGMAVTRNPWDHEAHARAALAVVRERMGEPVAWVEPADVRSVNLGFNRITELSPVRRVATDVPLYASLLGDRT